MPTRGLSYFVASLLLLAVVHSGKAVAAPRDESARVVPTTIHDRARAEGEVLLLVELALPSNRATERALSSHARTALRHVMAVTAARVLSRLATLPHRPLRRYLTTPAIGLQLAPG